MADRYWRGGAGTWNTTLTTNWATTSGAVTGGASVPTAADNVIFDQPGTYTVTMTGALTCQDITVSAGTVTFAIGTTPTLAISGSMSLIAMTWTSTGAITFNSTITGKTIGTGGTTINAPITFNGVGGGWSLTSALTTGATQTTTLTNGALSLNGFDLTTGIFSSSIINTRSIAFGSNNIILAHTTAAQTVLSMADVTNFTYTSSGTFGSGTGGFQSTMSVTRTFTFGTTSGSAINAPKLYLVSGVAVATLTTGSWFNEINFGTTAYTAIATTLNLVNIYNNSTCVLTSLTANMVGTGTINTQNTIGPLIINTVGATTTAQAGNTSRCTTLTVTQGSLVLGAASSLICSNTATWNSGSLDITSGTLQCITFTLNGPTFTHTSGTISSSSSFTITSGIYTNSGGTLTGPAFIQTNGTVSSTIAWTLPTNCTYTLTAGSLTLGGNLSVGILNSSNVNTRSIAFGTYSVTLTGGAVPVLTMAIVTGYTFTGTQNFISDTAGGRTFTFGTTGGALVTAPNLTFTGGGTSSIGLTTGSYFNNLDFTTTANSVAGPTTINITGNLNLSTSGNYSVLTVNMIATGTLTGSGTSAGALVGLNINTTGTVTLLSAFAVTVLGTTTLTAGTLNLNGFNLLTGAFSSSNTNTRAIQFGTSTITLTHSTAATTVLNMAIVTGYTFTGTQNFITDMAVTRTLVFGTTGGALVTAPNLTFTGTSAAIPTITTGSYFNNLDFGTTAGIPAAATLNITGNLNLSASSSYNAVTVNMIATGTLTSSGLSSGGLAALNINTAGTVTLSSAFATILTGTTTLTTGTLNLNNFGLLTGAFSSSNTNTRAIYFGTGTISLQHTTLATVVLNMATVTGFTYTTSGTFGSGTGCFHSIMAVTRTFTFGTTGGTATNAPGLYLASGISAPTLTTGSWFGELNFGTTAFTIAATTINLVNLTTSSTTSVLTALTSNMVGTGTIYAGISIGPVIVNNVLVTTTFLNGNTNRCTTLAVTAGTVVTESNCILICSSTCTLNGGTLSNNGQVQCTTLTIAGSTYSIAAGCSWIISTSIVITSGSLTVNFSAAGGLSAVPTFTHTAGSVTINTNYSLTTTGTYTLTAGTLTLGGNLTTGIFTSAGTGVRSIAFGTNNIVLNHPTAAQTVLNVVNGTNFTWTGTGGFLTDASVTRTIAVGSTASGTLGGFNVTYTGSGNQTQTLTNSDFNNLDFGTTTCSVTTGQITVSGLILSTGGTYTGVTLRIGNQHDGAVVKNITTNGKTIAGFQNVGLITISTLTGPVTTSTFTQTAGNLDCAGFNIICSGAATYTSGTLSNIGTITCTIFTNSGTFDFSSGTITPSTSFVNTAGTFTYSGTAVLSAVPTFTHTAGNVTFNKAYTLTATGTYTLTAGTLTLGSNLTIGIFSSTGTGVRSIAFSTFSIVLVHPTAATVVLSMADLTNFTWSGTGGFTANGSVTRSFTCGSTTGGSITTSPNLAITAGAAIPTITTASWFNNLDFTGSTATPAISTVNVTGNLTLAAGGTYTNLSITAAGTGTITPNGKAIAAFSVNGSGTVTLSAALSVTSFIMNAPVAGTINFATFNLTCSSTATYNSGILSNIGTITCTTFNCTGELTFSSGTITPSVSFVMNTAGTFTYSGTAVLSAVPTFTHTFGNVTFNKAYALTATGTYTLTAGTITLGANLTTGIFSSSGAGTRSIAFGTYNVVLAHTTAAQTVLAMAIAGGFTWTGTGGFTADALVTRTFSFGNTSGGLGTNAPNLTFTGTGTTSATISGGNFNKLDFGTTAFTMVSASAVYVNEFVLSTGGTFTALSLNMLTKAGGTVTVTPNGKTIAAFQVITGGTGTITLAGILSCTTYAQTSGNLDCAGFNIVCSSTATYTASTLSNIGTISCTTFNCIGDLTFSSGTINSSVSFVMNTAGTFTYTGGTLTTPVFTHTAGTVTLNNSLTVSTYAHADGTLSLNNYTLTTGAYIASGTTTTRFIDFSTSSLIQLTGNNTTIWDTSSSNRDWSLGTIKILSTYSGSIGTRTIKLASSIKSYTPLLDVKCNSCVGIQINSGATDTVALSGSLYTLDLTGLTCTFTVPLTLNILGDCTIPATGGTVTSLTGQIQFGTSPSPLDLTLRTITISRTIQASILIAAATVQLGADLVMTSLSSVQLYYGTLSLNGYNITTGSFNSNDAGGPRTLNFGSNSITVNGTGNIWDTSTVTTLTITGTPVVNVTSPSGTVSVSPGPLSEAQSISFNFTGASTLSFITNANDSANNVDFTGFTGTLAAQVSHYIYGNYTLSASMTFTAMTGSLNLYASTGTKTITTNGKTIPGSIYIGNGSNVTYNLGSALSCTNIFCFRGTFNTNNYNITCTNIATSLGFPTIFNLGSSTINLSGYFQTYENTTFNAGTSQINLSGVSSSTIINNGSSNKTFYNVSFTPAQSPDSITTITGTNTYNNLNFTNPTTTGTVTVSITGTQTINGILSNTSTLSSGRLLLQSSTTGTQITLSAATLSLTDIDFKDINATGTASPFTGTRLGNLGNNTNITFVARTLYWSLTAGGTWNAIAWAESSGGTPSVNNFPLPQDVCIVDNTGLTTGNTITINGNYSIGTLDMSSRNLSMTLNILNNFNVYGDIKTGVNSTVSGSAIGVIFLGNAVTQTLLIGGTFQPDIIVNSSNTTVYWQSGNLSATSQFTLVTGVLQLGANVSTGIFSSNNTNIRSIQFGSYTIELTSPNAGTTVLVMNQANNFTFTASGTGGFYSNMTITRGFNFGSVSGGSTSNAPSLRLTGSSVPALVTSSLFNILDLSGTGAVTVPTTNLKLNSLLLSSGGNFTNLTVTFIGTGTINSAGNSTLPSFTINCTTGTVTLAAPLTVAVNSTVTLTTGTLNLAGFTLTTGIFSSNNTLFRTIAFGTGNIILAHTTTSINVLDMAYSSGLTVTGTGGFVSAMSVDRTFTSGSANATPGSVLLDGTSQYLTAPVGASSWGTGDFTAECWFYKTSATDGTLLTNAESSGTSYWELFTRSGGTIGFQLRDSSSQAYVEGSIAISLGTWYHVAVTRQSGLVKLFVNGVLDNSATITKTVTARKTIIGSFQYPGFLDYFAGYISNIRLVTGVAVYTGNFTTPTGLFTSTQTANPFGGVNTGAITGSQTSLLLNTSFGSGSSDSSINNFTITNTGASVFVSSAPTFTNTVSGTPVNLSIYSGVSIPTLSINSLFNNLNFSGSTSIPASTVVSVYGDLTLATGGTYTALGIIMNGTGTITPNGKTIGAFTVNTSGTITLAGAFGCTSYTQTLGTMNFAGFNLTDTGTVTFTGGTLSNIGTLTCTTFTVNGATFVFSSGTITPSTSFVLTSGSFTYSGTAVLSAVPLFTHTAGSVTFNKAYSLTATGQYTLSAGSITLGANLTTGIIYSPTTNIRSIAFNTYYIFLATTAASNTVLNITDLTNFTPTGTGGFSTIMSTIRSFDSGITAGGSITSAPNLFITGGAASPPQFGPGCWFNNLDFTGNTGALSGSSINITGNLTLAAGSTYISQGFTMAGTGTITPNGKTVAAFTVNTLGTVTLAGAFGCTSYVQTSGTINFAGFNLTDTGTVSYTGGTLSNIGTLTCTTFTVNGPAFVFSSGTITPSTSFVLTSGSFTYSNTAVLSAVTLFTHTAGSVTFNKAYALTATGTYTLTAGTLILADSVTLTTGIFSSNSNSVRSITFGTTTAGNINLTHTTAATTVLNIQGTNITCPGLGGFTVADMSVTRSFVQAVTTVNPNLTFTTGASVATINSSFFNNLNFGTTTFAVPSTGITCSGSLILSGTGSYTLLSVTMTGTGNLNINGAALTTSTGLGGLTINTVGTITLQTAFPILITATTTLTTGTLNLNGFTLTTGIFSSSNSNTRAIQFGIGNIVLAHTTAAITVLNIATLTNFTWTGTGSFQTDASITRTVTAGLTGGSLTNAPNLSLTGSGTAVVTISNNNWYKNLDFGSTAFTAAASTLNIAGNLTLSSGAGIFTALAINAVGTGTITPNGKTIGAFTVNTSGTITLAGAFGCTSYTQTLGTMNFATFTLTDTGTVTYAGGTLSNIGIITCTTFTVNGPSFTFSSGTITPSTSFVLTTGSFTYNSPAVLSSVATFTHTAGTVTLNQSLGLTVTGTYALTAGTLTLADGVTLNTGIFFSSNANTRSINFGSLSAGNINLTHTTTATTVLSMAIVTGFTYTGPGGFTVADMANTRTLTYGTTGGSLSTAVNLTFTTGAFVATLTTASWFKNLNFGTTIFNPGTTTLNIVGNLTLSSGGVYTSTTINPLVSGTYIFNSASLGPFIVNTLGITITLGSAGASTTLAVTLGTLDFAGFNFTCSSTATYNGGTLSNIGTLTCTTFTNSGTFVFSSGTITPSVSFVNTTAGTFTYSGTAVLGAVPAFTHTAGSVTFNKAYALTATGTYTLTAGTLTLGSNLTTGIFSSSNVNTRAISFSTNNIVLATTTATAVNLSMAVTTGFTWDNTSTGGFTAAADITRTFQFGVTTAGGMEPNLTFTGSGTAIQTLTTSSWFKILNFGTTAFTIPTTSVNVNSLLLSSTSTYTGLSVTMFRTGTITPNGKTIAAFTIINVVGDPTITTLASALSCTTYTQTSGTIDFATFNLTCSGTATYTAGTLSNIGTITCTTFTNSGTFNFSNGTIIPSVSFVNATGTFTYSGTAVLGAVPSFNHTAGSVTFNKAYASTNTGGYSLTAGTLTLGSNLTIGQFFSSNANTRVISFGSNNIILNYPTGLAYALQMSNVTGLTCTGTGGFQTDASVTRTIQLGATAGGSATSAPNLTLTTGSSVITFITGSWFNNLNFGTTSFAITTTTLNIVGNLTLSSTGTFTVMSIIASGTGTFTNQGKTISGLTLNTIGTITLADAMIVSGTITLMSGTFNTSSFTLTSSNFSGTTFPNATASLTGSSTYNITGSGTAFTSVISSSTSLLLSTQNADNFTTDSSSNALTVTNNNSATFNSLTPLSGIGSILLDGTTQYLSIPGPNSSVLDLATGAPNWTIECWFNKNNITTDGALFGKDGTVNFVNESYGAFIQGSGADQGKIQWFIGDGIGPTAVAIENYPTVITPNTWYHFALVRQGNIFTGYLNGVPGTPQTGSGTMGQQGGNLNIGAWADSTYRLGFGGYISNFRITKGAALYTTSFTVPTSPLTSWISSTSSPIIITGLTLNMSSASAKTFTGSGGNYSTLNQGGSGALTVLGNNTFADITATTKPSTISFEAGSTQTVNNFTASGTSGNLVTINSTIPGTQFTLTRNTGITNTDYLSIRDSNATSSGTGSWYAGNNSTNVSNNLGWVFAISTPGKFFNFFFFD